MLHKFLKPETRTRTCTVLLSVAAVIVYCILYAGDNAFSALVISMLALGIVLSVVSVLTEKVSPLASSICFSVAIGGFIATMLTNIVNTYVHMANYSLAGFYIVSVLMLLIAILSIMSCYKYD